MNTRCDSADLWWWAGWQDCSGILSTSVWTPRRLISSITANVTCVKFKAKSDSWCQWLLIAPRPGRQPWFVNWLSGRKLIDMLSSCLWRFSESSLLHVEVGAPGDVFPVFSQSYLSCRCCCWESCQPGSDCQLFVLFCPHYSFICWAAVMESDEVCDADVTHHSEEVCVSDRGPPWIKWRHHFVF